jgi:molybdate transport system ATP-binding protein
MININIEKRLIGADGPFTLKVVSTIERRELITIYGPTGAGKSSIIKMVAGLLQPDLGSITVDNIVWFNSKSNVSIPPQHRDIGMVFQDYALFPNMTVRENLAFALAKHQDTKIVDELLEVSNLTNFADRRPLLLSGGQKQRVALARALVRKPKLLLLDEPLSALDSKMRSTLQDYILDFHKRFELTTILISHDLQEVLKMSGRVFVVENGSLTVTSPDHLLSRH